MPEGADYRVYRFQLLINHCGHEDVAIAFKSDIAA
jgi:hypothetical protein